MIEKLLTLYYRLLYKIIPCKILIVRGRCILREDCNTTIETKLFLLRKNDGVMTVNELLDNVFKSFRKHLEETHNLHTFIGLQFKTDENKYTIYIGNIEHE